MIPGDNRWRVGRSTQAENFNRKSVATRHLHASCALTRDQTSELQTWTAVARVRQGSSSPARAGKASAESSADGHLNASALSLVFTGSYGLQESRAFLASECNELPKAEKWRRQIISEVSKKVAQIQNAGLGEFKIRDLNDEINKLLRENGHWEDRAIGVGLKMLDREGKEVPGNRGYKYFGAAKDLPGVRELFESEPAVPAARKTRAELMKAITAIETKTAAL